MKGIVFLPGFISGLLTLGIILPAYSQVTSDGTTNTTVNPIGNNFTILNGIQRGGNLFHSFGEFSIPTGGSATFQNPSAIENIINRVTGGNISNIDGLIKANGSANLFLINPAGIVFGENASLDIGGSFLGSTAQSILFEDGFEFSAVNAQTEPLLTVSVPLGLQMGSNSGSINVQGNGHAITGGLFFPIIFNDTATGLQVNQGETLGLVGKEINLTGGIIRVPGGNIQLSSIEEGILKLDNSSQSWQFDTSQVQSFSDINLLEKSLLDTSGVFTGDIQLQGRNINMENASTVVIQNLGTQPSGNIIVNATDTIKISDDLRNAPDQVTPLGNITGVVISRLITENLGTGKAGDLIISGGNLFITEAGLIYTRSYTEGSSGSIDINIDKLIDIDGFSSLNPSFPSGISASTLSDGDVGETKISAQNLNASDGGAITSINFGTGQGGEVLVNVEEHITISGINQAILSSSAINSAAFRTGNSGDVTINTSILSILDGAIIESSTVAEGSAGKVTVNASESINISGGELQIPTRISSSGSLVAPIFRQLNGLPDLPSGDSGSVVVNTSSLMLADGGRVGVSNNGLGNSGDLEINTNQIFLDRGGSITAFSASGQGGDIKLNIADSLLLRNSSSITAEALGTGNGGNIDINSAIIAGFEDSDIVANAEKGNGGAINITTQGIFGLQFRDEPTDESDITASSKLGVNGTVKINNISIDPSSGLFELPTGLTEPSQQIATECSSNNESSFIATGRGGMPQNPTESVDLNPTWSDVRDLSAFRQQRNNSTAENAEISNSRTIVEATGLIRNSKGVIEFVVLENTPLRNKQVAECSGNHT